MINYIVVFVGGGLAFSSLTMLIVCITRTKKENDIYEEGFKDGFESRFGFGTYKILRRAKNESN